MPNKITGANAGGPRQLAIRTRWAARVAQFCRSACKNLERMTNEATLFSSAQTRFALALFSAALPAALCVKAGRHHDRSRNPQPGPPTTPETRKHHDGPPFSRQRSQAAGTWRAGFLSAQAGL
jgi:hypothetical protein